MSSLGFVRARRAALALIIILISALAAPASFAQQSLKVALYPYVPRPAQFEAAIRAAWAKVQPTVQLTFVNDLKAWDGGYKTNPPNDVDVFVFDVMYFEQFRAANNLVAMSPNEVKNAADFLPYAKDAVMVSGTYYAIPQLGCANILFYNANDTAIANATTISQLQSALKQCTYTSMIPPDKRGLMLDMSGSTTNASLYLDVAHSANGTYPLPQPSQPNATYVGFQKIMLNVASYLNITEDNNDGYIRGDWYSQGYGRAIMGFSETMSHMSSSALSTIAFKVMPLSNTTGHRPLFYVDAIGVNTTTAQRGTRTLAVELANVIASTEVVVASFQADKPNGTPQYLMSVRTSAFQQLGQSYPIYKRMQQLATSSNPIAFKLDQNARTWASTMGPTIRRDVQAKYVCGCDQTSSTQINSNTQAQSVCPAVCSKHGGWNGQWTNQPPAPGSVCGCNTCPIQ